MGGGLLGICRKKLFLFSELDKKRLQSWDNLQSWDPSLHFSFLNRPNFVTIFCGVLKMKIIFLSPAHRRSEFIDQKILPKKLKILYIFNKKNAKIKCREGSRKKLSKLHAIHLRRYLSCSIFKGWLAPWITNMCWDRLEFHENFLPRWLHYAGKQGIVPSGRWSCALGGTRQFTMLGLCASLLCGCLTSS